jgi:hypothetical protein
MLRLAIDTHVITSHFALSLLIKHPGGLVIEMTDGTAEYNADHYRLSLFYDLAKTSITRIAWGALEGARASSLHRHCPDSWLAALRADAGQLRCQRRQGVMPPRSSRTS